MNQLLLAKNYNLAFLGKNVPKSVYAVDKEMNCTWFPSAHRASVVLGITDPCIAKCLNEDKSTKYTGDYCFALANDIETTKKDGTVVVDKNKVSELREKAKIVKLNNDYTGRKAIYAIKADDLSATRFEKNAAAAKTLGIFSTNISACLAGKRKTVGGYYFIPAYKIELEDDNEEHKVDKEKLLAQIEELKNVKKEQKTKNPPFSVEIFKTEEDSCKIKTVEENKIEKPKSLAQLTENEPSGAKTKESVKNSSLERKYKKPGAIYALKDNGDCLEFKDLYEASNYFEVNVNFLYEVIKSLDGKYKNMFFVCDKDA